MEDSDTTPIFPTNTFPFFKLPPELRREVLFHATYNHRGIALGWEPFVENKRYGDYRRHFPLNLFLTSSKMLHEASEIFYEVNTFSFNGYLCHDILGFVRRERYRPARQRVRRLVVDLPVMPELLGLMFIPYCNGIIDNMIKGGSLKCLDIRLRVTGIDLQMEERLRERQGQDTTDLEITEIVSNILDDDFDEEWEKAFEEMQDKESRLQRDDDPSTAIVTSDFVEGAPFQTFLTLLENPVLERIRVFLSDFHSETWCAFHKRPRNDMYVVRPMMQVLWEEYEPMIHELNIRRMIRVFKDVGPILGPGPVSTDNNLLALDHRWESDDSLSDIESGVSDK
ncbi:hypothetical protein AB5N19_02489 [Seiridium cardinale]